MYHSLGLGILFNFEVVGMRDRKRNLHSDSQEPNRMTPHRNFDTPFSP